eukprot:gb/GFBE01011423.1/.p1 GENE.gb/GFBE01011423.1/~~gb/GFBE01011423.1/.p1  ORF type:complete len:246 (+),score=41.01 gb/GFBE01011423.1/:1-738(+)
MAAGVRGVRLAALLRGFGLCPTELSKQESKLALAALKTAYRDRAKEQHPDRAPDDQKAAAQERFVQLNTEFDEALKLLQAGVVPIAGWTPTVSPGGSGPRAGPAWQSPHFRPGGADPWAANSKPFVHSEPQQFDTYTRVKGHLIVWSSLFVFLSLMREFLVGCAGSTWAWSSPNSLNPFWVRRFKDEWAHEAQANQKEEVKKQEVRRKQQMQPQKQDRGVPSFYQKRGISNVRKQYSPRGHGPSL